MTGKTKLGLAALSVALFLLPVGLAACDNNNGNSDGEPSTVALPRVDDASAPPSALARMDADGVVLVGGKSPEALFAEEINRMPDRTDRFGSTLTAARFEQTRAGTFLVLQGETPDGDCLTLATSLEPVSGSASYLQSSGCTQGCKGYKCRTCNLTIEGECTGYCDCTRSNGIGARCDHEVMHYPVEDPRGYA